MNLTSGSNSDGQVPNKGLAEGSWNLRTATKKVSLVKGVSRAVSGARLAKRIAISRRREATRSQNRHGCAGVAIIAIGSGLKVRISYVRTFQSSSIGAHRSLNKLFIYIVYRLYLLKTIYLRVVTSLGAVSRRVELRVVVVWCRRWKREECKRER